MDANEVLKPFKTMAYRHALEDGIADIIVGVYTVVIACATQRRVFLALSVVYLVGFTLAWRFIRLKVSSSRIGYAELPEEPPRELLTGILAAGVATMAVVAAVTFASGRMWNLIHWPVWAPVLAGLILAFFFLLTALRSGLIRYYGYLLAALGGSVFFWLLPFGPRINPSDRLTLFLFALAALLLLTGVGVLVRFLRCRPAFSPEASDGR